MNLLELYQATIPHLHPGRAKDIKTALRTLARALGYDDPLHCPPSAYTLPLSAIYRKVEQQLTAKGPHTVRNQKNNLSLLFRTADQHQILLLFPAIPKRRLDFKDYERLPHRAGSEYCRRTGYYLTKKHWPPTLITTFADFEHWATAPLVSGRPAKWRKRASTVSRYRQYCESFFGYLHNIRRLPLSSLEFHLLFEWPLVHDYVNWHVNTLHRSPTFIIHMFLAHLLPLTRQYRPDSDLEAKLRDLKHSLKIPAAAYNKDDAWVSLTELEKVGKALWPHKQPSNLDPRHPHTVSAARAGLSLMLRLLIRRPYRQRNIREMELEKNLYQDNTGKWMIRFVGDQLKVGTKKGKTNEFVIDFPEDLEPILLAYLNVWRPHLADHPRRGLVFLNTKRRPYTMSTLSDLIRRTVFYYTGRTPHPHLIRTISATECIMETGNFARAAVMLGDDLKTVIDRYAYLTEKEIVKQNDHWLKEKFAV